MTRSSYVALFLLCSLSSCVKDADPEPLPTERTLLVYLAGDNDLSPSLSAVVESIRGGWSYTGNNCLIYIDTEDAPPRLLRVRGGCELHPTPTVETVATYPEENSASPEVFARVINKVRTDYPAPSYGLVFASHASGWLPSGTLGNPKGLSRSIGADRNIGTMGQAGIQEMELSAFARAIPNGQFDFIIFEACLMAGVEVAYELRHKTKYILASSAELLVPGFVPVYGAAQKYLFDTRLSVGQALTAFATDYYRYVCAQSGAYRSTTLSVIQTKELEPLATLLAGVNFAASQVDTLQHFDRPGSYGDAPALARYFDLRHAVQGMVGAAEYRAISEQIDKVVVWKASTPTILWGYNGVAVNHYCGLTTYIEQALFAELNTAYRNTAWYKALNGAKQSQPQQ